MTPNVKIGIGLAVAAGGVWLLTRKWACSNPMQTVVEDGVTYTSDYGGSCESRSILDRIRARFAGGPAAPTSYSEIPSVDEVYPEPAKPLFGWFTRG